MTVPATQRRAGPFAGNGATTAFPFTFRTTNVDELLVVRAADGVEQVLVRGTDYNVTLNPDQDAAPGGSVGYPISGAALPVGATLTIAGAVPFSQETDLPAGGKYSAGVVENALDRIVMQTQQLYESVGRALRLPLSAASADAQLPVPVPLGVLGWNSTGSGLQNVSVADIATSVAYGSRIVDTFTGDGVQTTFALSADPKSQSNLLVVVGGVVQTPTTDYTWATGAGLVFSSAPPLGAGVVVFYMQALAQASSDGGATTFSYALPGSSTSDVQSVLRRQAVDARLFGADNTGATATHTAIQAALDSGASVVHLPAGVYKITAPIVVPNYVTLVGDGYAVAAGYGRTRLLKTGNFTGVIVNVSSQLLNLAVDGASGNGGDGVQILGGRSFVQNVQANNHGRDGFHIGAYSTDPYGSVNTNLWRANNLIARGNARHGCLIQHEGAGALPNNNAGLLQGLDAGYNGGDGLQLAETVDNQLIGICCQVNTGYGIRVANLAKGNFIPAPYLEANALGDAVLEAGSGRNQILGARAGVNNSGYTDNGTENIVVGRYGSVKAIPLHESPEAFSDLQLLERTTSGVWRLTKQATTRHLVAELQTSATADLLITNSGGGAAGLRFGVAAGDAAQRSLLRTAGTLNFGSIPANSTADVTVTLTGADATYEFTTTPTHAIPAGVTWAAYWDATASAVKVRCTNATTTAKTVNGSFTTIGRKIV